MEVIDNPNALLNPNLKSYTSGKLGFVGVFLRML